VRTKKQIDELSEELKKKPGIVIYTLINRELREYLKLKCTKMDVKYISAIASIVDEISAYCGVKATKTTPDKESHTDAAYLKKIEAINFTVHHDDGQQSKDFNESDILITGVSRTSKSPTSFYLAQRGYKVANWPIINNVAYDFSKFNSPLIVGLTISIDRLMQIRHCRLVSKDVLHYNNEYTDALSIKNELNYANKVFSNNNIPVIDVTSKAIEEISAEIINLYFTKKGVHLVNL
jgi:regulator of PEP synthase PpsR (kinase-PPPase family)